MVDLEINYGENFVDSEINYFLYKYLQCSLIIFIINFLLLNTSSFLSLEFMAANHLVIFIGLLMVVTHAPAVTSDQSLFNRRFGGISSEMKTGGVDFFGRSLPVVPGGPDPIHNRDPLPPARF